MANDAEQRWRVGLIALGGLVVVAAIVAAVVALGGDDDDDVATVTSSTTVVVPSTADTTTTSVAPTTSTTAPTTSAPTTAAPTTVVADESLAVWPVAGSGVTYADPVDAARAFAEDLVGFTDPVVGEFQAGDSRSGEVPVQAREDGPVTTVLVRQLGEDGSWSVLGSQTADIELSEPSAGSVISSPVALAGRARAFEGTVDVRVLADDASAPIGQGFVTGSGGPDLGPFAGEIDFTEPADGAGVLILSTVGGEDSVIWQATVIRVGFGG